MAYANETSTSQPLAKSRKLKVLPTTQTQRETYGIVPHYFSWLPDTNVEYVEQKPQFEFVTAIFILGTL